MKLRYVPLLVAFALATSLSHANDGHAASFKYGGMAGNAYCYHRKSGRTHEQAWWSAYKVGLSDKIMSQQAEAEEYDIFAATIAINCHEFLNDWTD